MVVLVLAVLILTNPRPIGTSDIIEVKSLNISSFSAVTNTPADVQFIASVSTGDFDFYFSPTEETASLLAAATTDAAKMTEINQTTSDSPQMRTASPQHPCVIDVDESEPEFQRYVCTGNWAISLVATTFLLTMIFFAVISKLSVFNKIFVHHGVF